MQNSLPRAALQHILRARHPTPSMRGVLVALAALAAAIAADAQTITVSTATQTSDQQVKSPSQSQVRARVSQRPQSMCVALSHGFMILQAAAFSSYVEAPTRRCDKPSACPHGPVLMRYILLYRRHVRASGPLSQALFVKRMAHCAPHGRSEHF